MTAPALPDAPARRRAAHEFGTNLVVVAGAGAGKTSLLVERILSALGRGIAGIGQLAAITFTEKAAGEMRERLAAGLERLRALAAGELPADGVGEADRAHRALVGEEGIAAAEVAGRALAALQGLDRARVATIHAFCAELLREHPLPARLAPDFMVDEGEHARALFEEEWARFAGEELRDGAPRGDVWRALLRVMPLAHVREAARLLAGFAVPASALAEAAVADPRSLFAGAAERLAGAMASILARQQRLSTTPRSYLDAAIRALEALREEGLPALQRQRDRDAMLRRDRPPEPNARLEGVAPAEYREVTGEAHRLIRGLAELDEERFERLLAAVTPFAHGFRETMLRRGIVSFDGLLALARDLLRDHPEVREQIKRRYRLLLLDEFQDTDPLQYEIVLFLAEVEGGKARDAYAAELAPGRLFVVGDPKQSIYRFRGADYSAFLRAVERIGGGGDRCLHLVASFRGRPGVLEPVNALLSAAGGAWQASDYQPAYEPIRAVRPPAGGGPRVELWTVEAGAGAGAEERREAEGRVLAAEIARMVEAGECDYRDVLVMLRAFTQLPLYLRPLREAGIPFVVDGGRELLERTEVVQLLAVLRAVARSSDPVAVLAFLRSPAGGVSDRELAAYATGPGDWDWGNRVDPGRHPGVARAFGLMRRIAGEIRGLPADAAIRHVVEATGLLPLAAFGYEGAQRVANLRKVAAAGAALARDGRLTLNEILDALEGEPLADLEGESPLADETWQSVRILTVHKAKGLENQVVFVPDLAREELRGGFQPPVDLRAIHPPGGPRIAIRAGQARNAASLWYEEERRRHETAEEVRTLYVALTRARERLVLFAGRSRGRAPWVEALAAWGYRVEAPPPQGSVLAGGVLHRVAAPESMRRERREGIPAASATGVRRWERALERMRQAAPPFAHPSGLHEEEDERRDRAAIGVVAARAARARARARAVGRTAHRLLERWDRRDGEGLLAPLAGEARAAAGEEGIDPAPVEREAREVLGAFLASPLAARLREVEVLGREIPTLRRDAAGTTWRGSIDLLYRERGEIAVADFKTDPEEEGALPRYRPQMEAYREAVRAALSLPRPPRAELWMLRSGRVILLDDAAPAAAGQMSLF